MHNTACIAGAGFSEAYGKKGYTVVDIGGLNVNGSLRQLFEEKDMKYICVDMEQHPSVDIVVPPGQRLPFEDGSVDLVISTSCFEHDPCFWITIREMARIVRIGGYIYVNAPNTGPYHEHPGDNWRFYSDAGQALAYWSSYKVNEHDVLYPLKVIETFNIHAGEWRDFVCIWERTNELTSDILVHQSVKNYIGPTELFTRKHFPTGKKC